MTNGFANGLWLTAVKNAVASVTGILMANLADPSAPVISFIWWKHVAVQSFAVVLLNEARYWKNWAEK